jgi:hypothetical protein
LFVFLFFGFFFFLVSFSFCSNLKSSKLKIV